MNSKIDRLLRALAADLHERRALAQLRRLRQRHGESLLAYADRLHAKAIELGLIDEVQLRAAFERRFPR